LTREEIYREREILSVLSRSELSSIRLEILWDFTKVVGGSDSDFPRYALSIKGLRETSNSLGIIEEMKDTIISVTQARAFFVGRKGYIGLASLYARKADTVAILLGDGTPYILCQQDASAKQHEFLLRLMSIGS
jgi:hypothetical protein